MRISNDDIRNMLGHYGISTGIDLTIDIDRSIAIDAMRRDYDIVVDNLNLHPEEVKLWQDLVDSYNNDPTNSSAVQLTQVQWKYEIEFKNFFIPLEECIRRDSLRPNPVGEKVIRKTWKMYKHFIQTIKENYGKV